jgi:hypothetical protein
LVITRFQRYQVQTQTPSVRPLLHLNHRCKRCQLEDVLPVKYTFSAVITVERLAPHDWPCWKVKVSCVQRPEQNTLPNPHESATGFVPLLSSAIHDIGYAVTTGWCNCKILNRD